MDKNKRMPSRAAVRVISGVILTAALAWFGYWCFTKEGVTPKSIAVAAAALGLLAVSLVIAAPALVSFFSGAPVKEAQPLGPRSGRKRFIRSSVRIILALLISRVLLIILAYVFARLFANYTGSLISSMRDIWVKLDTDAPHYFSIAENWYTTEAPQMYTLVFLPLFPLLIRAFNYVFHDSFVSAMVINTLCSCAASVVIFRLAMKDMGRRSSKAAVIFAFALPAAIFYIAPMSEALFLLLSALTLLLLRKGRFIAAGIFGALACFTRSLGIIMAVPFLCEGIRALVLKVKSGEKKGTAWLVIRLVLSGLIFCTGTAGYLLINKLVWGEWFKFMQFQREVWYQQLNPFFDTVALQTDELFRAFGSDNTLALGLWLPNLLYIFGALLVLVFCARTLRTSYTLYFAAYVAVACGASWLLSAPRYLTALVVLPLALAHLCEGRDDGIGVARSRTKTAIVFAALFSGQVFYLLMYVMQYGIY